MEKMSKKFTASFWRSAYFSLASEVDQVLGKALGYPWYCDDQENFPGTKLEDGVCTGDNCPESLLGQAAQALMSLSGKAKSLVVDESVNVPCTAALEVELQALVKYFEKKAKENEERAAKKEASLNTFLGNTEAAQAMKSAYYFSGKADSYARAAEKLKEALYPEKWIVEVQIFGFSDWTRSLNKMTRGIFSSKTEAEKAIEFFNEEKTFGKSKIFTYRAAPMKKQV